VVINGDTKYMVGREAGTRADVVVGADVTIQGLVEGETFTAVTVHVELEDVSGEVTAKTASTLTLRRRNGETVTVHVDGDTTYRVRGKERSATTLADIAVGDRAEARGQLRANGSIDAQSVRGKKPRPKPAASASATTS
jgi:hypothetical protein